MPVSSATGGSGSSSSVNSRHNVNEKQQSLNQNGEQRQDQEGIRNTVTTSTSIFTKRKETMDGALGTSKELPADGSCNSTHCFSSTSSTLSSSPSLCGTRHAVLSEDFRLQAATEKMKVLQNIDTLVGRRMNRFSLNAFDVVFRRVMNKRRNKLAGTLWSAFAFERNLGKGVLHIIFSFLDHAKLGDAILGAALPAFRSNGWGEGCSKVGKRSCITAANKSSSTTKPAGEQGATSSRNLTASRAPPLAASAATNPASGAGGTAAKETSSGRGSPQLLMADARPALARGTKSTTSSTVLLPRFLPALDPGSFLVVRLWDESCKRVVFQDRLHRQLLYCEFRALLFQKGVFLPEPVPDERFPGDGVPFKITVALGSHKSSADGASTAFSFTKRAPAAAHVSTLCAGLRRSTALPKLSLEHLAERAALAQAAHAKRGDLTRQEMLQSVDLSALPPHVERGLHWGTSEQFPVQTVVVNLQINQNQPKIKCFRCGFPCRRMQFEQDIANACSSERNTAFLFQEQVREGLLLYKLHGRHQCGRCWLKLLGLKTHALWHDLRLLQAEKNKSKLERNNGEEDGAADVSSNDESPGPPTGEFERRLIREITSVRDVARPSRGTGTNPVPFVAGIDNAASSSCSSGVERR
ncbi:unnamed protein product [Amoebophrya sp. A120]|nr:unnamed protein product [Amoebophrya sp. A120]|eukprot:GSA120T00016623001.1